MLHRRQRLLISVAAAAALALGTPSPGAALEPYLTPGERFARSDAVFDATVIETRYVSDFGLHQALWVATVRIDKRLKGDTLIVGQIAELFYLTGRDGWRRACPPEVVVACDDTRRFFAMRRWLAPAGSWFLDSNSSVSTTTQSNDRLQRSPRNGDD